MDILKDLNDKQKQAVLKADGPLLILAGAGSGKTKTLTHKVAYLIGEKKIQPGNILAVTFTNKAAQEMRERIFSLLGMRHVYNTHTSFHPAVPIIGTFHSICVKILRRDIDKLGRDTNFNIFDTADQKTVIKQIIKDLQLDPKQFKPGAFLGVMSKAKNELSNAQDFQIAAQGYYEEIAAKVFVEYEKRLLENNAYDFDDLLSMTIRLFKEVPPVLHQYQNLFQYILVDEYQDTNHAQYTIINMLSEKRRNLCVVGDDWQSIYAFRGADIQNILNFEKDYPDAKIVHLEQNYRSTQVILDAAHGIISNNVERKDKKLWTEQKAGHLITSYEASDEVDEAEFVVSEIQKIIEEKKVTLSDVAILYRTNAQSRALEEVFLREDIVYKIIGGLKFYDRKEIKDILSYLRFIKNPCDTVALMRIANEPKRGIGKTTLEKWIALESEEDRIQVGLKITSQESGLREDKAKVIREFSKILSSLVKQQKKLKLSECIESICEQTGYKDMLLEEKTIESEARWENIQELLTVSKRYDDLDPEESLEQFLEDTALVSDTDDIQEESRAVQCMTLHSSKGLEFPYIFIVGLEEGILPHSRSYLSQSELEEERRLMYVGITRAREKVYLLYTLQRALFGNIQANPPSRFLSEIPQELIEETEQTESILEKYTKQNKQKFYSSKSKRKQKKKKDEFVDGEKVSHEKFGQGMIISQTDEDITIAFQGAGLKKLAKGIVALTRL